MAGRHVRILDFFPSSPLSFPNPRITLYTRLFLAIRLPIFHFFLVQFSFILALYTPFAIFHINPAFKTDSLIFTTLATDPILDTDLNAKGEGGGE